MYYWIVLSIILCLFGVTKDKSKFATYSLFVFLFVVFAFNRDTYDYNNYINEYFDILHGYNQGAFGAVYTAIMRVSAQAGLDYATFEMILSFVGLLVIYLQAKSVTQSTAFVFSLYLLFPAYLDGFHTRFFMGEIVMYAALIQYMKHVINSRKLVRATIMYMALVIVATLIHSAFLFFAVIPVITLLSRHGISNKKIALGVMIVAALLLAMRYTGLLTNATFSIIATRDSEKYGLLDAAGLSIEGVKIIILYCFRQSIRLGISYFLLHTIKSRECGLNRDALVEPSLVGQEANSKEEKYLQFIVSMNIVAFLVVILQTYTVNFERLYRIIDMLIYIGAALAIGICKPYSRKRIIIKLVMLAFALGLAMDYFLKSDFYIGAYKMVFTNNVLFSSILN